MSLTAERYKNKQARALDKTEIKFTRKPMFSTIGIFESRLPRIRKNGVPGGCGT